jgi:ubiquinone/menaquinone biosynthesis C-methylase UbiE
MLLGLIEDTYIASPLRAAHQRWDLARFQRLTPIPPHSQVLDVGCGTGLGLQLLHTRAHAATLTGVDADAKQIARSRARLSRHHIPAQLHVADATALPLPAASFDVVTSFGCLHHLPNWQTALTDWARVLKHGGLLYLHEYYAPLLHNPLFNALLPHPPHRFTHAQLLAELPHHGFTVLAHKSHLGGPTSALTGDIVARHTNQPLPYE